jgi:FixJ family two-component response regulator
MLTGFANAGDLIREISTGLIQFFISKPWSEEQMRKTLERATLSRSRKKD